jgi:lipopolysaccharide export system protein LptA
VASPTLQDVSDKLGQIIILLGNISVKQDQPIIVAKKVVVPHRAQAGKGSSKK